MYVCVCVCVCVCVHVIDWLIDDLWVGVNPRGKSYANNNIIIIIIIINSIVLFRFCTT